MLINISAGDTIRLGTLERLPDVPGILLGVLAIVLMVVGIIQTVAIRKA